MRTFLKAWRNGIGVIGIYVGLSIVVGVISLFVEVLPAKVRVVVGIPLAVVVLPPLFFWAFRWIQAAIAAEALDGLQPLESMSFGALIKLFTLPAAVTSFFATVCLTTPEIITEVLGFALTFAVSLIVLLVFAKVGPLEKWRLSTQRAAIWIAAAFGSLVPYTWLIVKHVSRR